MSGIINIKWIVFQVIYLPGVMLGVIMSGMKTVRLFFFVLLFLMPILGGATSLLRPTQFPTTSADASFVERMENLADGYEPYAGMSAYQIMIFEEMEDVAQQAIEKELVASGIDDSRKMTVGEEIQEEKKSQNTPPIKPQPGVPETPGGHAYCSRQHPGIPYGQKIPFGLPVNTDDLAGQSLSAGAIKTVNYRYSMFCDAYRCRDRGDGVTRPHKGIDIGCKADFYQMPIYATADGVVQKIVRAGSNSSEGNFIRLNHGNGWSTQYMHLDKIFVEVGQNVSAGCLIGLMGHTGGNLDQKVRKIDRAMTHLHYGILYSGSKKQVMAPNGTSVPIKVLGLCSNGKGFDNNIDPLPLVYFK